MIRRLRAAFGSILGSVSSAGGTFFSVGCPACVPAVGALFSAIGLGFLINMTVLRWLTIGLLSIGILGLYKNSQSHKYKVFLIIGIVASFVVFSSRYLFESTPLMYGGAAILIGNALFDYRYARKCSCCNLKNKS